MNTQNKPDREEVIEQLKTLKDRVYFHVNPSYKMTLDQIREGFSALESAPPQRQTPPTTKPS